MTDPDTSARMAQHFEAMNDPAPNWPLLIGAACLCIAVVGGGVVGVGLAMRWW